MDPEIVNSKARADRKIRAHKGLQPARGRRFRRKLVRASCRRKNNAHQLLSDTSRAKVATSSIEKGVVDEAIKSNPDFQGLPATGQKALRELVRPNVHSTLLGPSVDYKGVLKSFNDEINESGRTKGSLCESRKQLEARWLSHKPCKGQ